MIKIQLLFSVLLVLIITSCATMFNLPNQNITIITREPGIIKISDKNSLPISKRNDIQVPRSSDPLTVSVYDSLSTKQYSIRPHNSFAYWLNLYPSTMWLGFLIDMKRPERYSYPRIVYIDSKYINYLTYIPLDSSAQKLRNIVKVTPYKILDISNPSIELSYERITSQLLSSQLMFSYLLPNSLWEIGDGFKPQIKGYKFGFEEKIYLKKSAPLGPYLALELNHLSSKYKSIESFHPPSDSLPYIHAYSDSINIIKEITNINFKVGYQVITGRFTFDFYGGFGARYKSVSHLNRINSNDQMTMPREPNFNYITNLNGKYWIPVFLLSLRIGWLL
jgi:hypothetical protein